MVMHVKIRHKFGVLPDVLASLSNLTLRAINLNFLLQQLRSVLDPIVVVSQQIKKCVLVLDEEVFRGSTLDA